MNQKLRLAIVSETTVGGVRKHIVTIAKNLDRSRFEITLVISPGRPEHGGESDLADELIRENIPFIVAPFVRKISPTQDFRCLRFLRTILIREKFDLVHAHGSKAGFLCRKICHENSVPCFYSPHVFAFERAGFVSSPIYLLAERVAARWDASLIVNASWEKETALRLHLVQPGKVFVVPNSIEIPAPVHSDFRKEIETSPEAVVFLTTGRLVHYKGQSVLLKAFAQILSNSELWLLGEGEEKKNLLKLAQQLRIAERVRFLGYRKNPLEILAASDCFVLPSRVEGFPYTLLEALALEKPIIATNVPGNSEILSKAPNARTVPWNDPSALRARLTEFLQTRFSGTPREQLPRHWFDVRVQIATLEKIYPEPH
jgi:glycosyltransferase involved in cell wall biosynthesis